MIAEPAIVPVGPCSKFGNFFKLAGCVSVVFWHLLSAIQGFAEEESPQEKMFYAARAGRLDEVRKLLAENPKLATSRTDGTRTPLHLAAEEGHLEIVELLLANGADVNVVGDGFSSQGWRHTPLHLAVRGNHLVVVQRLLEAKADVRARDLDGATPLHFLNSSRFARGPVQSDVKEPELEIAKLLLEHGAKLFMTNRFSATPFSSVLRPERSYPQSTEDRRPKLIDVLLSEGDLNEHDNEKNSIVDLAARHGRIPALARLLERKVDLAATNVAGLTPLQTAISFGQQRTAEWLLDHGMPLDLFSAVALGRFAQAQVLAAQNRASLSRTNAQGDTVLHWAARREDKDIAEWLLDEKILLNAQNRFGETALHLAARQTNFFFAQFLIKHQAKVNLRTSDGASALEVAAQRGDEKMVNLLLQAGAEINPANKNAKLPLHSAVLGKNQKIVEVLLDRGAEINARDDRGQTALHLAALHGDSPLARLLVSRKADINVRDKDDKTALDLTSNPSVVQILVNHQEPARKLADLESRQDERGRTRFLVAVENNDYEMMESLLKLGADINARDPEEGNTALHDRALRSFQWDEGQELEQTAGQNSAALPPLDRYGANVGKFLLDRGANANATNNLGQTAMHMIGRRDESGEGAVPNMTAAVKLLLQHHADINARDNEGRTPLHLAAAKGAELAAQTLIANGANRNARDNLGRTPFLTAAGADWMQSESAGNKFLNLLQAGQNSSNDVDYDGNTALHLAAKAGNHKQIERLLAHGANKAATNKFGRTPLYFALQNQTPWAAPLLMPKGGTPDIFQAAARGDLASIKTLVECDPNLAVQPDRLGGTPLHSAARGNQRDVVEYLLKFPVKVNAQDRSGRTPLHWAYYSEAKEIIAILLAHDADAQAKDTFGRTPANYRKMGPKAVAKKKLLRDFAERYWVLLPILVVAIFLPVVWRKRFGRSSDLHFSRTPV